MTAGTATAVVGELACTFTTDEDGRHLTIVQADPVICVSALFLHHAASGNLPGVGYERHTCIPECNLNCPVTGTLTVTASNRTVRYQLTRYEAERSAFLAELVGETS